MEEEKSKLCQRKKAGVLFKARWPAVGSDELCEASRPPTDAQCQACCDGVVS